MKSCPACNGTRVIGCVPAGKEDGDLGFACPVCTASRALLWDVYGEEPTPKDRRCKPYVHRFVVAADSVANAIALVQTAEPYYAEKGLDWSASEAGPVRGIVGFIGQRRVS